jgi:hypothetical protein
MMYKASLTMFPGREGQCLITGNPMMYNDGCPRYEPQEADDE